MGRIGRFERNRGAASAEALQRRFLLVDQRHHHVAGIGIFEGDLALIRKSDTAETGDIVVALIDEEEATLKRLRKKGASIALEAANPAYETRIFGPDRVRIQGKLVGLFRRY